MKHLRSVVTIFLVITIIISSQLYAFSASATKSSDKADFSSTFYLGDVNCDGQVSAVDARTALRISLGLESYDETILFYADCTQDGKVTALDARKILRISLGLEAAVLPNVKPNSPSDSVTSQETLKQKWIESFPKKVSYKEIDKDIAWLVEDVGIRNWWDNTQNDAADLIYDRVISYGYTSENCKKINFVFKDVEGRNILATIPTGKKNADILLVVAHYDTVRDTGGAVDNASGVVTLLQLAKVFKNMQEDYGVELRFLFTAGEEQGYYGANNYVESLSSAEKARHKFVFNIDMAAKPNDAFDPGEKYYIAVSTEPVSTAGYSAPDAAKNIGSVALDQAKSALGNLGEDGYYSPVRAGKHDIVPFRKAGMPALTLSWRCIDKTRGSGNDYDLATPILIHTATDNMKNIDVQSLYDTTRLVAGATARLVCPYIKNF